MTVAAIPAPALRVARDEWIMRLGVALLVAWLLLSIALPLWALLSKSFQNADGAFVGLANYVRYFSTPSLFSSIFNSIGVAIATTMIVIPLAFVYAYALTRSRMRFKGLFYAAAMLPLFAPSLLSAISLIYLFGNQGLLKGLLR
jgi:iron(III) transport system permease protein